MLHKTTDTGNDRPTARPSIALEDQMLTLLASQRNGIPI